MKAIVAVDEKWAIGKDGNLLVHLSEDLKYFKRQTTGGIVVMGRKTLESFPGGKPLPGRENIVMTHSGQSIEGVKQASSVDDVMKIIKDSDSDKVFVIGGGQIYSQFLPYCDEILVTKIRKTFDADTFFSNLDEDKSWEMVSESEVQSENNTDYTWCIYRKVR